MDEIKPSISKLTRLIAIVVIVLSLVATSITRVNADFNSESGTRFATLTTHQSGLQNKLNELEIQKTGLDNISQKISIVEQQIVLLYQEIETTNEQITICEDAVNVNNNIVNANQSKLENKHEQNCQRISSMSVALVETCTTIFSEGNVSNLANKFAVVEQIAKDDKNAVDEINQMLSDAEDAQSLLSQQRTNLIELENQMIYKRQELYDLMLLASSSHANASEYSIYISQEQIAEIEQVEKTRTIVEDSKDNDCFGFDKVGLSYNVDENGISWLVPCIYKKVSSPFGYRIHPVYGDWRMHNGVDLTNKSKTAIYATRSGVVVDSGWDNSSGYHVVIDHLDGYKSCYLHLYKHSDLKVGDVVIIGDYIGGMGTTGVSTGTHLHFGISYNGDWVDPMDYIEKS